MGSLRTIEFGGIRLCVSPEVYEPAEDTELLLGILRINKGESVLEVGSGSGVLGVAAAIAGGRVTMIDINPYASKASLCSSKLNNVDVNVINCDLTTCLRKFVIDVALFNPPYLPVDEYREWLQFSWSGGRDGNQVIIRFLDSVRASRYYFLASSLGDIDGLLTFLRNRNFKLKTKTKVIGFEELVAFEAIDAKGSIS